MPTTNFSDGVTPINASWLNDVDAVVFGDGSGSDSLQSNQVRFTQAGTGAVARTAQSKMREQFSVLDFMTAAQVADVQAGTAAVNVATAIQAAIDAVAALGGTLFFPTGIYLIGTTTLVFKNHVIYKGAGLHSAQTKGTVIKYTGTSDAIQINNPINSSTGACISIEDLWVQCTVRTAGKAAIADVGSTYLSIKRVGVSGNDYGMILDQSEIVSIDECNFAVPASGTAGLWLVNGAEHTGGASGYLTNRITVEKCQFDGTVGVGIADDGGTAHSFINNNFNAMAKHIRVNATYSLLIQGNEFEAYTTTAIEFAVTKVGGAVGAVSTTADIGPNFFSSALALPSFTFAVNSLANLTVHDTHFNHTHASGTAFSGLTLGVTNYLGYNNRQQSIGSASVGNSLLNKTSYTPTFASSAADALIGNGTISGTYVREGGVCTATVNFTVGTTTTLGTGQWRFGLPFTSQDSLGVSGAWYGTPAGTFRVGTAVVNGAAYVLIFENAVGPLGGASYVWANGNVVNLTITYPVDATT